MAEMDRVGVAQTTLVRVDRWIEVADAKARVLLTLAIFLIGVAILRVPGMRAWYEVGPTPLFWCALVLAVVGIGGLAVCIHLSIGVAYPRLNSTSKHRSMFFFEHIAVEKLLKLQEAFRTKSETQIVDELIDQVWNVARVAQAKYDCIAHAIRAAYIGGVAALLFLLVVELFGARRLSP